jgi:hypothetical protein
MSACALIVADVSRIAEPCARPQEACGLAPGLLAALLFLQSHAQAFDWTELGAAVGHLWPSVERGRVIRGRYRR